MLCQYFTPPAVCACLKVFKVKKKSPKSNVGFLPLNSQRLMCLN